MSVLVTFETNCKCTYWNIVSYDRCYISITDIIYVICYNFVKNGPRNREITWKLVSYADDSATIAIVDKIFLLSEQHTRIT